MAIIGAILGDIAGSQILEYHLDERLIQSLNNKETG